MMKFTNLTKMVQPRNIVIIGATERPSSHARATYENIVDNSNFSKDHVFLVNPKYETLFGEKCYKNISDINCTELDVAIILVSAKLVARVTEECAKCKIPFAIVMSSGFIETGIEGEKAQKDLLDVIERTGIRIYGPNCPGLTDINRKLGMTFSPGYALDTLGGSIGLVTQGGGIGRTVLQGQSRGVGFGYFFSPGNELDLELSDFIHYMLNDPSIKVIAALAEGFKNGEKFKKVAKLALQKGKPIVILKIGKSELGKKAALSHTGAMAGSDRVFEALCKQYGIIRVNDVDELLETSALIARGGVENKGGIAIVTGSGGSGSLVADLCGQEGLELASLSEPTIQKLNEILPPFATVTNPVDITASFMENFSLHHESALTILEDENVGIIIEPINANYGKATEAISESLVDIQKMSRKVIIPIWMSSMEEGGYKQLNEGGLVPFRSIRNTVSAVKKCTEYKLFLKEYSTLDSPVEFALDSKLKLKLPNNAGAISEYDSKKILKEIGIHIAKEGLGITKEDAVSIAEDINYPVVLKIVSKDIPHKTESGGIRININSKEEVKRAYDDILSAVGMNNPDAEIEGVLVSEMIQGGLEMIVGLKQDPQFGSVVLVGMGGIHAELMNDVEMATCPVSEEYAMKMISKLKTAPLLNGYRNTPKRDIKSLALTIVQLSKLGTSNTRIEEIDINPLLVMEEGRGVVAIDALVVVNDSTEELQYS